MFSELIFLQTNEEILHTYYTYGNSKLKAYRWLLVTILYMLKLFIKKIMFQRLKQ